MSKRSNYTKRFDDELNHVKKIFMGMPIQKRDFAYESCRRFLDGKYMGRIKKAMTANAEIIEKRYKKDYFSKIDVFSYFCRMNLCVFSNYNMHDVFGSLRIGAAIWMLEELQKAGNLEKAIPYMLNPDEIYSDDYVYNITHLQFPKKLVESMILTITLRYKDYKKIEKYNMHQMISCVISEEMVEGASLTDNYKMILSLLPEESIAKAEETFVERFWACCDLLFKCHVETREKKHCMEKEVSYRYKDALKLINPVMPMAPVNKIDILDVKRMPMDWRGIHDSEILLDNRLSGLASHTDELEEYDSKMKDFLVNYNYYFSNPFEMKKNLLTDALIDEIVRFNVNNPYELCFALFNLIDKGDDIPWCFAVGTTLMGKVYGKLPWGKSSFKGEIKPLHGHPFGNTEYEVDVIDKKLYEDVDSSLNYYESVINGLTVSQMLYRASNVVVPYNLPVYTGVAKYLTNNDDGFNGCLGAMAGILKSERISDVEFPKDSEVVETDDEETRRLQQELEAKDIEIKKLRDSLAEMERCKEKSEQKVSKMEQTFEKEKRELSDLRTLVFNQRNDVQNVESIVDTTEYPYVTKKQMVSFGGHDTFLKGMRSNFPELRFIDGKTSFHPDVIRNSDVVWIQSNAISHTQFWDVVAIAKRYDKTIRYYVSAGIERCSKQIVDEDAL